MTIFTYAGRPSDGLTLLSSKAGFKRIRSHASKFRSGPNKTVVNWGCSNLPRHILGSHILNDPEAVAKNSDKLAFFQSMPQDAPVVPWTASKEVAAGWVAEGRQVVCRTLLKASGGKGIVIAEKEDELVDAPLYTQYVPKNDEYRIHCIGWAVLLEQGYWETEVIDVQRKARRSDAEAPNWAIRNLANGFVYVRNGFECPQAVTDAAIAVFENTCLDFGAVDVLWNASRRKAYVLEVNTAPGLEGTTVDIYADAFRKLQNV